MAVEAVEGGRGGRNRGGAGTGGRRTCASKKSGVDEIESATQIVQPKTRHFAARATSQHRAELLTAAVQARATPVWAAPPTASALPPVARAGQLPASQCSQGRDRGRIAVFARVGFEAIFVFYSFGRPLGHSHKKIEKIQTPSLL